MIVELLKPPTPDPKEALAIHRLDFPLWQDLPSASAGVDRRLFCMPGANHGHDWWMLTARSMCNSPKAALVHLPEHGGQRLKRFLFPQCVCDLSERRHRNPRHLMSTLEHLLDQTGSWDQHVVHIAI